MVPDLLIACAALLAFQQGPGEEDARPAQASAFREQSLSWAHEGLPAGMELDSALRQARATRDRVAVALVAAAGLVPERVSGRAALSGAARRRATEVVLQELLQGPDDADHEVLFERLRGELSEDQLTEVTNGLLDDLVRNRLRAVSVVIASSFSRARPHLLRLVLSPATPAEEQERIAERLLGGGGRPALSDLEPLLLPGAPDGVLRRLLGVWQTMVQPEDRPRLELLAREASSTSGYYALQIWAQNESDPEARLAIFELCQTLPPKLQLATLRYLGNGGQDERIAARLVAALDSPRREERQAALQVLPAFLDTGDLFFEYRKRIAPEDLPERRGRWMVELARLPHPEAQSLAAEWLVNGGWRERSLAAQVMRNLRGSAAVDPFLDRLLFVEEAPDRIVFPLAISRASESETARVYLRRVLEQASGIQQQQVVEALADAGQPVDLALLLAVAREPQFAPSARAAAVAGLARHADAQPVLLDLLRDGAVEYEVLEALVRSLVLSARGEVRGEALELARSGRGLSRRDERLGIRLAAWQAQEGAPIAAEAGALAAELVEELREASRRGAEAVEPLSDPRRMTVEHPRIYACARACAAAIRRAGGLSRAAEEALQNDGEPFAVMAPLILAAAQLSDVAPRVAARWCRELSQREGLHPSARLRAKAAWARAAQSVGAGEATAAWASLREQLSWLRDYPWELGFGLNEPSARGWVLPADRIAERALLAQAEQAEPEQRAALLESLAGGYCAPGNLVYGAEIALATPAEAPLAIRLARAATEWAPREARTWQALARAASRAGDPDLARDSWRRVLWLSPPGSRPKQAARRALEELGRGEPDAPK